MYIVCSIYGDNIRVCSTLLYRVEYPCYVLLYGTDNSSCRKYVASEARGRQKEEKKEAAQILKYGLR